MKLKQLHESLPRKISRLCLAAQEGKAIAESWGTQVSTAYAEKQSPQDMHGTMDGPAPDSYDVEDSGIITPDSPLCPKCGNPSYPQEGRCPECGAPMSDPDAPQFAIPDQLLGLRPDLMA